MNDNFLQIINASKEDRRGLFLLTANRLGTSLQNIEKDFWVCWILDLIFNGRQLSKPRLLFKGGTSLSKGYSLISRFSEDIDITVFKEDLGFNIDANNLETLSGKQQRKQLELIRQACQDYIQGSFKEYFSEQITDIFHAIDFHLDQFVMSDPNDLQQQTLLIHYPSVIITEDDYIKPTIKIEAGAKSALDPHKLMTIQPYISEEFSKTDLSVKNVVTIEAERTFWDKVIILHGMRSWYDNRGEIRQNGHRVSRHYYDIYQLMQSSIGAQAVRNFDLAIDCVRHASLFFNNAALNLKNACPGSFALVPPLKMQQALYRDYQAMSNMIFGDLPEFLDIIDAVRSLETTINETILI